MNKETRIGEIPFCFLTIRTLESKRILREHHSVQTEKSISIVTYCVSHMLKS